MTGVLTMSGCRRVRILVLSEQPGAGGEISLDAGTGLLHYGDAAVVLSPQLTRFLSCVVRQSGAPADHSMLRRAVWPVATPGYPEECLRNMASDLRVILRRIGLDGLMVSQYRRGHSISRSVRMEDHLTLVLSPSQQAELRRLIDTHPNRALAESAREWGGGGAPRPVAPRGERLQSAAEGLQSAEGR